MASNQNNCELCNRESFQLVPRVIPVEIEVRVCHQCAANLGTDALTKAERRKMFQEASYQWAEGLHGKSVTIFWDNNTAPSLTTYYESCARGTAYHVQNAASGWGQVKVVLDPSENSRVSPICHHTMRCEMTKRDMFFAPPVSCSNTECEHLRPSVDGKRFGLILYANGDGNWYALVSWGCRKTVRECE